MIYINTKLEKINGKMFQFFPLRTDIKPHYIPIDTKSIIEIFIKKNKNKYLTNINNTKYTLWKQFFNIDHKVFQKKKYIFDYRILTDGYAVSIQFINKKYVDQTIKKKENIKNAKHKMKL